MGNKTKRMANVKLFFSLDEENEAEYERRRKMTPKERMEEFAILQQRRRGASWTSQPIEKKVSSEKTDY